MLCAHLATILGRPQILCSRPESLRRRNVVRRRIARVISLGVPVAGASSAAFASWVTARRITAPGPREKRFVTPWEFAIPYEEVAFRTKDGLLLRGWWLPAPHRDTVRKGTFERHEQIIRLHIRPSLGSMKLKALSPAHVQGFYRERLDSGLSPATVHKIHSLLHKALDQAVGWLLVPRNATEVVTTPRPAPDEIRPLDSEQVKVLLEVASGERFEAVYVLAIHTGLRQGELLGLKWDDVDLENGLIRVRRTLARHRGHLLLGEPKTKRSRRTVRLTERAVDALRDHLARQVVQIESLGDLYRDQGLIFATQKGTLVNPSNLRKRYFAPLLEKAGLPSIRFHDLRHTCATLLLARNVNPKIVSEMLGHATIAITLDTYSHVLPDMQDSATRALEDVLR
jgi:integrase